MGSLYEALFLAIADEIEAAHHSLEEALSLDPDCLRTLEYYADWALAHGEAG
jgi:hypothetical protein